MQAGPRSDKISPNKLEATTTSNHSDLIQILQPKCQYETDLFLYLESFLFSLNISSQNGIVIEIPFDFVAFVSFFLFLVLANSKANLNHLHHV